ncbi:transferase spermidine synthase [Massilia sp. RP-1-19]|uniref:Transferase spermidine synthase n=1 Tax=Massilia polaris TaxID=2728846 RepID=A0A848HL35_9BURK|nr:transferase spermidine synthase [Massilia polaris]NML61882.1 transferase spermidine synthase [Massilia polaris]
MQPPEYPLDAATPIVATRGDRRTLEFAPGEVQSEMRLSDPDALVLAYCRAIMCFALFVPRPRHILMVGLGGGSLAKFCYRHFPQARITVVELRADVIALREQFHVPADDARFEVVHADAASYLACMPATVDVLVVDGFDAGGLPPVLGSARFYGDCRRALRDGGVMAANMFSYDPHYRAMFERLRLMFDDRVCRFDKVAGNNRILFAVKAPLGGAAPRALTVQRLVARRDGLGAGWLNRLLARAVVRFLAHI